MLSKRPWSVCIDINEGSISVLDAEGETFIIDDLDEVNENDFHHLVACVNAIHWSRTATQQTIGG